MEVFGRMANLIFILPVNKVMLKCKDKRSVTHFVLPGTELRNDHKDITNKIDQNIQLLHSAKLTTTTASVKDSG